jgi:FkbM family methyltransferase
MLKITKVLLRIIAQILVKFNFLYFAIFISSLRASLLMKKSVIISNDGKDWIYKWNSTAAVSSVCYYDPNFNYSDLDLFFFKYTPNIGDVIVNVGVENGAEIPEFCKLVGPSGKVYAIEADPSCCRRIEKLKKILNLDNLIIIHVAAGSIEDNVKLSQEENEMSNRIVNDKNFQNNFIEVKQKRLDKILEPFNENKIDYIKSNIEGAEIDLLKGLNKSKLLIKNWCISCHDFKGINYKSYDFVRTWLEESGYAVSNYKPHNPKTIWRNYYLFGSK